MDERYVVKKESGSQWAYLRDTKTGSTVCRSNVLKKDAWSNLISIALGLMRGISWIRL